MRLRADNLRKVYKTRFDENLVLSGISFELGMGERLGILGRNGAGKSTLIRLLSGAERPTTGRVESDMSISWPIAFGGAFQPNLTGLDLQSLAPTSKKKCVFTHRGCARGLPLRYR